VSENSNDKKTIGLYAVILFTSAFIVLLLTAYSQMKFSKSAHEYKNLITTEEKAKINFKTNLNSALDENSKLENELNTLKKDIDRIQSENDLYKKKLDQTEEKSEKASSLYELIVSAQNSYIQGNIIECALILKKQIDPLHLDSRLAAIYHDLVEKSFGKAARKLFETGRKEYSGKNYSAAKDAFQKAVSLNVEEYFIDDCYYYLAYSEYWLGNSKGVERDVQILLDRYPSSSYRKDALNLLKNLK
jgi:TolA-binding protein